MITIRTLIFNGHILEIFWLSMKVRDMDAVLRKNVTVNFKFTEGLDSSLSSKARSSVCSLKFLRLLLRGFSDIS